MNGPWPGARQPLRILMRLLSAAPRRFAPAKKLMHRAAATCAGRLLGRSELPGLDELGRLRPPTRVLVAGLAAWIGLVGVILAAAVLWVELSTISLPSWLGASWLVSSGARGRGIEAQASRTFDNIVQRPLFLRSRQAVSLASPQEPPPPSPPPVSAGPDTNIALRGVFINGDVAKAFLISSENPAGVWAQTNEEVAGWRVIEIRPDQVLLGGSGQRIAVQYTAGRNK